MRIIFFTIIIILIIINLRFVEGFYCKKYLKNIRKNINIICNKEAYLITNYTDIYNCMNNNSNNCMYIENYKEYINIKNNCVKKYNDEINIGIIITIISWLMISLLIN